MPTHSTGNRLECPRGHGVASNRADLGLLVGYDGRRDLVRAAADRGVPGGPSCPFCAAGMVVLEMNHPLGVVTLDVCSICQSIWCDPGELTKLSRLTAGPQSEPSSMADAIAFSKIPEPPWRRGLGMLLRGIGRLIRYWV